jgi:hypothetical protein
MDTKKWMQVAFDEDGQPTDGKIEYMGYGVKFHRNLLYILDKRSWSKKGVGFGSPFVEDVENGTLHYKHFHIVAEQGPDKGIYAAVQNTDYLLPAPKPRLMVGASVLNPVQKELEGLRAEQREFLIEFLRKLVEKGDLLLSPGYLDHIRETTRKMK